jgi:hypothetical protein
VFSEIHLEEYGYTPFPGSYDGGKMEDLIPGGEDHFTKSETVQGGGSPGALASMEIMTGNAWLWWGQNRPQDVPS